MTEALVRTHVRLQHFLANREAGQGTLEYVGMVVIASLFVVGLVAAAKGANLDVKLTDAISKITDGQ